MFGKTRRSSLSRLAALFLVWCPAGAAAESLAIVTSYPPAFFEPIQRAFEARYKDIAITIIQRNTASAIRFVLEGPQDEVDLFWASSPDAFERLKAKGALQPTAATGKSGGTQVGGYPVDDPKGFYVGFALSKYGLLFDPAYIGQLGLKPPHQWEDLLSPAFGGHIGMTTPSRSGTTHLMVETLLQRRGWAQGWAMLSRLGGNLSTVTARSFGVASGVAQRRFAVGLTIDFLSQLPLQDVPSSPIFVAFDPPILVPASIAILKRSRSVEAAQRFVDFLLSRPGQLLLLDSSIKRIPADPELAGPFAKSTGASAAAFDPALSAQRYDIVNLIFDEYIARRRATLSRLWTRLETLEMGDQGSRGSEALAEARIRLEAPPMTEDDARALSEQAVDGWQPAVSRTASQNEVVASLQNRIEQRLSEAERLIFGAEDATP